MCLWFCTYKTYWDSVVEQNMDERNDQNKPRGLRQQKNRSVRPISVRAGVVKLFKETVKLSPDFFVETPEGIATWFNPYTNRFSSSKTEVEKGEWQPFKGIPTRSKDFNCPDGEEAESSEETRKEALLEANSPLVVSTARTVDLTEYDKEILKLYTSTPLETIDATAIAIEPATLTTAVASSSTKLCASSVDPQSVVPKTIQLLHEAPHVGNEDNMQLSTQQRDMLVDAPSEWSNEGLKWESKALERNAATERMRNRSPKKKKTRKRKSSGESRKSKRSKGMEYEHFAAAKDADQGSYSACALGVDVDSPIPLKLEGENNPPLSLVKDTNPQSVIATSDQSDSGSLTTMGDMDTGGQPRDQKNLPWVVNTRHMEIKEALEAYQRDLEERTSDPIDMILHYYTLHSALIRSLPQISHEDNESSNRARKYELKRCGDLLEKMKKGNCGGHGLLRLQALGIPLKLLHRVTGTHAELVLKKENQALESKLHELQESQNQNLPEPMETESKISALQDKIAELESQQLDDAAQIARLKHDNAIIDELRRALEGTQSELQETKNQNTDLHQANQIGVNALKVAMSRLDTMESREEVMRPLLNLVIPIQKMIHSECGRIFGKKIYQEYKQLIESDPNKDPQPGPSRKGSTTPKGSKKTNGSKRKVSSKKTSSSSSDDD